jgi:NAD(P)-dependent dehydrogenase (short-subunit alcohol dehydrogenase family)
MRKQNIGGDIVNIVSKNSVVSGPNNAGYGSAKAAQAHLTRLLAAELGGDKIRVNTVKPRCGKLQTAISGLAVGRRPCKRLMVLRLRSCLAYYAKRTLLNENNLPDDIANACYAFIGGLIKQINRQHIECGWRSSDGFFEIAHFYERTGVLYIIRS